MHSNNSFNPFNNSVFKNLNAHNAKTNGVGVGVGAVAAATNAVSTATANVASVVSNKVAGMSMAEKVIVFLIGIAIVIALYIMYALKQRHGKIDGLKFSGLMDIDPSKLHDATVAYGPKHLPLPRQNALTYSCWIYIDARKDGWYNPKRKLSHIMHVGEDNPNWTPGGSLQSIDPQKCVSNADIIMSPGIFIHPRLNRLIVKFCKQSVPSTFDVDVNSIQECIPVDDVNLNQWTHIAVVISHTTITIYLDAKVVQTHILTDPSLRYQGQPYIHACEGGGFPGHIALLQYYDRELNAEDIAYMYKSDVGDFAAAGGSAVKRGEELLFREI